MERYSPHLKKRTQKQFIILCCNNFNINKNMHGSSPLSRYHLKLIKSIRKQIDDQCQSQLKTRVYYQRYINDVNQELQSLVAAGKLKRMQVMSINNRALFNKGKVQRSQWLTNKYPLGASQFLPDLKNININNCSNQKQKDENRNELTLTKQCNDETTINASMEDSVGTKKKRSVLSSNRTQDYLICPYKINPQNAEQDRKITKLNSYLVPAQRSRSNFLKFRKEYRRSVTEAVYHEQLKELQRKQDAVNKERGDNMQLFLRKIKFFNKGNF